MTLSRRSLVSLAGATLPALALAPTSSARTRAKPVDLGTAEGWLTWIRAHRNNLTLSVDDGRGTYLCHRNRTPQPLASAVKIIHLATYATAVTEGRLDPQERVRLGDWERFYVPTDGGAHAAALKNLGIPTDATGLYAADPNREVTLDQMAAVMIEFSDSAVPDVLRNRLGLADLRLAAARGGWVNADIRSLTAEYLFLILPDRAPRPGATLPERRAIGFALEREYSSSSALRRHVLDLLSKQLPSYDAQLQWASDTAAATATQLSNLHHSISRGAHPGAKLARYHLERPSSTPGMGLKGGALPGVLTCGMMRRREDGSFGSGALMVHGGITPEQISTGDPGMAVLLALDNAQWRDRLSEALRD